MASPESPESLPPFTFSLVMATAVAVLLIGTVVIRATAARRAVAARQQALLHDVNRLADAESDLFAREGRYTDRIGGDSGITFVPSPDVVVQLHLVDPAGWVAVVRDTTLGIEPRACGIFIGPVAASPHRAVTTPGTPACW